MAQKKTPRKKVESKKPVARKKVPLYLKIGIVLAIGIIGFLVYRTCVNRYDVALLDKAEAKMRELPIPPADYTTYERSCSFKSVKFGGAGSPNCDITRRDVYLDSTYDSAFEKVKKYFELVKAEYPGSVVILSESSSNSEIGGLRSGVDNGSRVGLADFMGDLTCYSSAVFEKGLFMSDMLPEMELNEEKEYLSIHTSCYKNMKFQLYPES